jgi:hypothetical protein
MNDPITRTTDHRPIIEILAELGDSARALRKHLCLEDQAANIAFAAAVGIDELQSELQDALGARFGDLDAEGEA